MGNMKNNNKFVSFSINKNIFNIDCVCQTASFFTKNFFVSINENDLNIDITIANKIDDNLPDNIEFEFKNKLIDHKAWMDLNNQFGGIRDIIVEQAFSSAKS